MGEKDFKTLSWWTACVVVLVCAMRLVCLALCFITVECLSWRALECGEMLMDPGIACCSWYRWNPPPAHHWSCCLGLHLIIPSVKWDDYSAYCIWWVRWCMRGDVWCMRDDIHEVMYESPPGPPRSLISSPCMLNTRTKSVIQVGSGRWGAGGLDWVLAYFTDEKTEASPPSPVVTLLVCIIALLSCLVTMVT